MWYNITVFNLKLNFIDKKGGNVMAILKNVLIVVQIIVSLVLTTVVLMQSGKEAGLSGSIAGGAETFFGKNKARTIDGMLSRLTTVLAILFIVISLVLSLIIK